jgi:ubiquinone/menaquinone biosynthesis C-methylase UbiE
MTSGPRSFDRLARPYRALEFLAFGGDLERARFCLLDRLRDCRRILVLGEGDGRCLARLVRVAPAARIRCLDFSGAMLARAAARIDGTEARTRVTFEHADILAAPLAPASYDAVLTLFFLDCFTAEQTAALVARVAAALTPEAAWLFADFVLPPRGLARLRARAWVTALYAFFRWQTGLPARALPPSEELIERAGFARETQRDFQGGLLRSVLFRRAVDRRLPPGPTAA